MNSYITEAEMQAMNEAGRCSMTGRGGINGPTICGRPGVAVYTQPGLPEYHIADRALVRCKGHDAKAGYREYMTTEAGYTRRPL